MEHEEVLGEVYQVVNRSVWIVCKRNNMVEYVMAEYYTLCAENTQVTIQCNGFDAISVGLVNLRFVYTTRRFRVRLAVFMNLKNFH